MGESKTGLVVFGIIAIVAAALLIFNHAGITANVVSEYPPEISTHVLYCTEIDYGQQIEIDTTEISAESLNRVFGCNTFNREKRAICTYDHSQVELSCENGHVVFNFL